MNSPLAIQLIKSCYFLRHVNENILNLVTVMAAEMMKCCQILDKIMVPLSFCAIFELSQSHLQKNIRVILILLVRYKILNFTSRMYCLSQGLLF